MNILHKLAALFTIIFVFSVLLTLLAILLHALSQRRRRFQKQQQSINDDVESEISRPRPFYVVCCIYKKKSQQQPQVVPAGNPPVLTEVGPDSDDVEECWQALYGNSMLLYTIKEEEKEGSEISTDFSGISSTEGKKRWLAARISEESGLAVVDETVEETGTPYYTPSNSPEHECFSTTAEYGSGEEDGVDFRLIDMLTS